MDAHSSTARMSAGSLRLPDWGVLAARGADAADFLHGQLTQDVKTLGPNEARLAGYCSPKGRLLATFWVVRGRQDDEILLACSADLLAATLKRLSMFVLRARCKLADASHEVAVWGEVRPLEGEATPQGWPDRVGGVLRDGDTIVLRLPDADGMARTLRLQPGGEAAAPASLAPEAWQWLEVQSAVPRVMASTADQFVPQMINLQAVGGVNFQKGCYPGQEVVARSQYRGTLKRRGYLLQGAAAAQPGDELVAADDPGQPAGLVALAAPVPGGAGGWQVFAEVKIAAAEGSVLHLGRAGGPVLRPLPLPYLLPVEA